MAGGRWQVWAVAAPLNVSLKPWQPGKVSDQPRVSPLLGRAALAGASCWRDLALNIWGLWP